MQYTSVVSGPKQDRHLHYIVPRKCLYKGCTCVLQHLNLIRSQLTTSRSDELLQGMIWAISETDWFWYSSLRPTSHRGKSCVEEIFNQFLLKKLKKHKKNSKQLFVLILIFWKQCVAFARIALTDWTIKVPLRNGKESRKTFMQFCQIMSVVISDHLFQITLYTLVGTQGHNGQSTDRGAIFENQCTHQQMGH